MEEKKFVEIKKDELSIQNYMKSYFGKGRVSKISIEYTPIGEKIIISTNKPGLVIGRKGEKIIKMTENLRKKFKLENPHIEIQEITKPQFDSQLVADNIAIMLEKRGSLKFKVIAYRTLREIMDAGALGAEIRLNGKLPGDRARPWRFAQGYLKKVGETAKIVNRAEAIAKTVSGIVGIKVAILSPDAKLPDKIEINKPQEETEEETTLPTQAETTKKEIVTKKSDKPKSIDTNIKK